MDRKQSIPLADISPDSPQVRVAINPETVSDYAEAFKSGDKFPPLEIFFDGKTKWLADGFHRRDAALKAGLKSLPANVHQGTRTDCLKFALTANSRHGLRETSADKRHKVTVVISEFPTVSSAEIARMCGVSHTFVNNVRPTVQPETVSGCARKGADGKIRAVPPPRKPQVIPPRKKLSPTPAPLPIHLEFDAVGSGIPDRLLAHWNSAHEVDEIISCLITAKKKLKTAHDSSNPIFAHMNCQGATLQVQALIQECQSTKPYALCPSCRGKNLEQCTTCKHTGFISKFLWDTGIPEETKNIIIRTNAANKP